MNLCPKCGAPVPPNEWGAYRKHEDCYVPLPPSGDSLAGLTPAVPRGADSYVKGRGRYAPKPEPRVKK